MYKTYITSTEMTIAFANWSEYTSTQTDYALQESYLQVNSYIKPSVKIPPVLVWDGVTETVLAPSILKQAQSSFCRYILENRNLGWTEELENMRLATVEMLRDIENGELGIETQIFAINAGINIIDVNSAGSGSLEVLNSDIFVAEETYYEIEIDSAGLLYPYGTYNTGGSYCTFKWKTSDTPDWIAEDVRCDNAWQTVGNVTIRFTGALSAEDSWKLHCIPTTDINATGESKLFKQTFAIY